MKDEEKAACPVADMAQRRLLRHSLKPWSGKGFSLLEINGEVCGFLSVFAESDFDVAVTAASPEVRNALASQREYGVDISADHDDSLSFEDESFDVAVLHLTAHDSATTRKSMDEAIRVAKRGVAVCFWNSLSLPFLLMPAERKKRFFPLHNALGIWRRLKADDSGFVSVASTLFFSVNPPANSLLARCARWNACLPFGAWVVVTVVKHSSRPGTALPLRFSPPPLRPLEPAMEFHKRQSSFFPPDTKMFRNLSS